MECGAAGIEGGIVVNDSPVLLDFTQGCLDADAGTIWPACGHGLHHVGNGENTCLDEALISLHIGFPVLQCPWKCLIPGR